MQRSNGIVGDFLSNDIKNNFGVVNYCIICDNVFARLTTRVCLGVHFYKYTVVVFQIRKFVEGK